MRRDGLLLLLTVAGSALCWWPAAIEPSIDFPRWILLVLIACTTGFSVSLSRLHWSSFAVAAIVGAFGGMYTAWLRFPVSDGIGRAYAPFAMVITLLEVALVALLACLAGRRLSGYFKSHRRLVWLGLVCCVACGPAAFAVTPAWVAHRVVHNDQLAMRRFTSLKSAVERTVAEGRGSASICDGHALMRNYSGPRFSEEDWRRITGNYVGQDGYVFMVYCHEQGGYSIDAFPPRGLADGRRRFCADESGRVGCGTRWNGTRYACVPCN